LVNQLSLHRDPSTGLPLLRGITSQELWERKCDFEELFSLMVFGNYPTFVEREALRYLFAEYMKEVPKVVGDVIRKFPYVYLQLSL
jgi:citrate synthase